MATPGLGRPLPDADLMPEELHAAIVLFASLLDERQRRLFAGLESLKWGWGGERRIATLLGIDPSTVATGRRQLVPARVGESCWRSPPRRRPSVSTSASSRASSRIDGAGWALDAGEMWRRLEAGGLDGRRLKPLTHSDVSLLEDTAESEKSSILPSTGFHTGLPTVCVPPRWVENLLESHPESE